MLDKNSFRTIRAFGGSQQNAFEELICQLARLAPPPFAKLFVRKDGAGGDAGVECFWIMADGSEHAWQAKFFLDKITPGNWAQIDDSVETALKKHPNLKKYYVCIPVDRTDTRATGPGGRQSVSVLDEWNEHAKTWTENAASRGMEVEFEYWGAHEILLPLQSDNPKYSGRALFWFNAVVLTTGKLNRCIEKQERTLGERYTPEFHVDLPIAHILDGVVNGDRFWQELNHKALEWNNERSTLFRTEPPNDLSDSFRELRASFDDFKQEIDSIVVSRKHNRLVELQQEVEKATSSLRAFETACRDSEEASKRPNQHSRSFQDEVLHFAYRKHSEFAAFLNSDFVNANIASAVLVTGKAGAGKSHLLCDFARGHITTYGPAILMLGQHYRGGNPLAELLDLLDLKEHSYETVLGAFDAAGEAAGVKAILLIDAINEGSHRNEWRERIVGLLEDVRRFPHIALVISCRSRFDDLLIPSHIKSTELLRVTHEGFRGHEHKAAAIYLSGHGIAKPTTPVTAPEFSNPLFLKTCATALKQLGETSWPKGYQGSSRLFEIYLSSLEAVVSRKRNTEINDRLCQKALEAIANEMFPDNLFGLGWDYATAVVNAVDTCANPTDSLFQTLLREGALAEDIDYSKDDKGNYVPKPIVRFAYERFSDQFVAQKLLRDVVGPGDLFNKDHPLGKAIDENRLSRCRGILDALAVIIPEKFGIEFWDVLPADLKSNRQSAEFYFFDSLPYRAPSSFTDKTSDLFNSLRLYEYGFQSKRLDLLLQFAAEPTHPWNAERLHKLLAAKSMPERDSLWSVYVAKNDYEEEYDGEYEQPESTIRSTIEWATFGELAFVEEKQARLSLITLIWFTTTTNRRTRDQATKAASRLFARYPSLVVPLLTLFQDADDLYLQERLYASAYGGLCNAVDDEHLKSAAKHVFESQFKDSTPIEHLLLRDFARGIVELAISRDCLDESIVVENCRPPYKSDWPLENPPANEFNHYGNKIEYSVFSDDFGRYTMGSIHKWSPTPLVQVNPESRGEVLEKLIGNLDESSKRLFDEAIRITRTHEEQRWQYVPHDSQAIGQEVNAMLESEELLKFVGGEVTDPVVESLREEIFPSMSRKQSTASDCPTREDMEGAWKDFSDSLDDTTKESFRWSQGFWRNENITASFSRKWAQRWVCKHAIGLGWTAELFEDFEKSLGYDGRNRPRTERIGKKYQRIAYHTFLAHLADNVHYTGDEGYSDTPKPSRYRGPWQQWERDIDPTQWLRKTSDSGWGEWNAKVWWRPFEYKFALASDDAKRQWCEDPADLPRFERYIKIDDESKNPWYSLRGFSQWREKEVSGDASRLMRDIWFRINSIIVKKEDLARLKRELKNEDYISPHIVSSTSTCHQVFLREYPWHPSVTIQDRFAEDEAWGEIKVPHIVPYAEYEWEQGSGDQSADINLSLYMPSSFLIEKMLLRFDRTRFDCWLNHSGNKVFIDPSLEFDGPSFALLDSTSIDKLLVDENLVLVWLIGGQKMVIDNSDRPMKSWMVFNTMLWTKGDGKIEYVSRHYMRGAEKE